MAKDVVATMSVAEIALVQTVKGDWAVWIDGKETPLRAQVEDPVYHRADGLSSLSLLVTAGRLELRA